MSVYRDGISETSPRLSLVIPAYNEASRLRVFLPPVLAWLDSRSWAYEILVIDDGSTDGTAEVARELGQSCPLRVLRQIPNRGKGSAIRRGMLEAVGDVVLFSDADFSAPIEEAEKLLAEVDRGADVAFGSRALESSQLEVRQPLFRELSGRFFNFLVRKLLLPNVRDTQCGFKAFRREVAQDVFSHQTLDGFAFDVEALVLARQQGYRLVEVPVRWINDPASKVSMKKGLQGFADLFRLRLKRRSFRGSSKQ